MQNEENQGKPESDAAAVSEQKSSKTSKNIKPKAKLKHDALVKKVLCDELACREFLEEYLPDEFKARVDLTQPIIAAKESYVEEALKHRYSDLVFKVKLRESNDKNKNKDNDKDNSAIDKSSKEEHAFVYCLLESQSEPDPLIAFRLLKYSVLLLEKHVNLNQKKKQDINQEAIKKYLPEVIQLVIYNGKVKYNVPLSMHGMFKRAEAADNLLKYNLIDLQAMDNEQLGQDKHLNLFLYMLKNAHKPNILETLKLMLETMKEALRQDAGMNYIYLKSIIWYASVKIADSKRDEFVSIIKDSITNNKEGKVMRSIADAYLEEGYDKGIIIGEQRGEQRGQQKGIEIGEQRGIEIGQQQGIEIGEQRGQQQMLKLMLKNGSSIEELSKLTKLPPEYLANLKKAN